MQACVDVAFPYAHLRESFGKKIGEHQVRFWSHLLSYRNQRCSRSKCNIFNRRSICRYESCFHAHEDIVLLKLRNCVNMQVKIFRSYQFLEM